MRSSLVPNSFYNFCYHTLFIAVIFLQEFRVWNIGDYKCVQIRKFSNLHPKSPTAIYVHPHTEVVMVATGNLGVLEPSSDYHDRYVCDRAFSHNRPLCGALYNDTFDQVGEKNLHCQYELRFM